MAKRLQHRGGTTSQHSTFTGAVREVTVDTDKNTLVVHDGATAGGHPLAKATDIVLVTDTTPQLGGNLDLNSNDITGTGNIDITGTATVTGLTTTGNINFGDNDIAQFGASNDLRIYHDGTKSIIEDVGTGDLLIRGTHLVLQDAQQNEFINCTDTGTGGTVTLKHNASTKLTTSSSGIDVTGNLTATGNLTSTGIDDNATSTAITIDSSQNVDVAGTITADGLTVDAEVVTQETAIALNGTSFADTERLSIDFQRGSNEGVRLSMEPDGAQTVGDFVIETGTFGSTSDRLRIEGNGDISFYEDTGTTPKMFWDASTERLGIGLSSPESTLHVEDEVADNSEEASFILGRSKKHSGYVSVVTASTGTIKFQISSTSNNYRSAFCKLNLHGRTGSAGGVANHPSAVYYFTLVTGFGATANFSTPTLTAVYENVFDKATDFAFSSTTNNKTCTLTFTNPTSYIQNTIYYTLEIIGERFNLDSVTKT